MSNFRSLDRHTAYLLPPSVDDWLPQDHLARFIVEVVDGLDLRSMVNAYGGRGSAAYHPSLLLSLLIYGYATGVFSSRRIERATCDSVAFRFIAAGAHPDHDTLATFRRRFLGELADQSNVPDGISLPEEIQRREDRLKAMAAAKTKIEARAKARFEREQAEYQAKLAARTEKQKKTGRKPDGRPPKPPTAGPKAKDQFNLTDEESRIMPVAGGGFEQSYNAQAAVDADSMLVMAPAVTQACNDKEQVEPMLAQLAALPESLGKADTLLADTGYFSAANVTACEKAGIDPYIAVKRENHHQPPLARFAEPMPITADSTPVERMAHKLQTRAGRTAYALRKQTVEPVFGIIKSVLGFRQFSLRGLGKVSGEWALVCLAWNLKRIAVLRPKSAQWA